jgi:hypothetical protein
MNKPEAIQLTQTNSVSIRIGKMQKEERRLRTQRAVPRSYSSILSIPSCNYWHLQSKPPMDQDTAEVGNLFGNTKSWDI